MIGVNSTIKSLVADGQEAGNIGLAFAIPINQAKRITQDIIGTGKARRTVIGAQVGGTGAAAGGGVRLDAVEPSGPAAGAGLKAGDVILRLERPPDDRADRPDRAGPQVRARLGGDGRVPAGRPPGRTPR